MHVHQSLLLPGPILSALETNGDQKGLSPRYPGTCGLQSFCMSAFHVHTLGQMSSRTNHDRCWAGSAPWLGFYPEQVIFEEHQDYLTKSSNVISTPRTSGPAESAGELVKTNRWAHAQAFWLVGLGWGLRICICKFLGAANAAISPGAGL